MSLERAKEIRKLNNNCDTVIIRYGDGMPVYYCQGKMYRFYPKNPFVTTDYKNDDVKKITDWRDYAAIVNIHDKPKADSLRKVFYGYNKYIDMAILSRDPKLFKYILKIYDVGGGEGYIYQLIFKGKKLEKVNSVDYSSPREFREGQRYIREEKRYVKTNVEERKLLLERLRRIDSGERLWETEPLP